MTDDAIREGLLSALDEAPDDRVALSALADWYEEHGDPASAAGLRWAVYHARRPGFIGGKTSFGAYFWGHPEPAAVFDDPAAQLSEELWRAVGDNEEPHPVGSFKSYRSGRAAFLALATAWKRLGETSGAAGAGRRR